VAPQQQPRARSPGLSLWDAVSIIIGIVVGVGIYETPPRVFANVSGPWIALGAWALAGLLSLVGAFCYAELASTYPHSGGDYVYLSRAFHPWVGFLFGWAQLVMIGTGNVGMMAYVFADYAVQLRDFGKGFEFLFAALAVTVLTFMNLLGLVVGKGTQNLLTACKVLGLGGILVAGLLAPKLASPAAPTAPMSWNWGSFGLAMVFVLYTFGGWNDAALVAAEQRNGKRNIPLALILGTLAITLIYLLINAAYLLGLGFERAKQSQAVAADLLKASVGEGGSKLISVLIMISALGAINGMILTRSRVYSLMGAEYRVLGWLGKWHPRWGVPVWSLLLQWVVTLGLIVVVGTSYGQSAITRLIEAAGLGSPKWEGHGGFDTLLSWTSPVFWTFFLLSGLSLFVLRWKDRQRERVFKVPLYPVFPLIFCATCAYMLYSSAAYAGKLTLVPAALVFAGLLICLFSRRRKVAVEEEIHKMSVEATQ
jgi:basic amino acid/polyamine antiporter, APA family